MKKIVVVTILLFVVAASANYGQKIGKLFPKAKADSLFGKVVDSATITKTELKNLLGKTKNHLMFRVEKGELSILGDGRKILYSKQSKIDKDVKFHMFSKSVVKTLLDISDAGTIQVEQRENALTVDNDWAVMELSTICPPFCP